MDPEKIELTKRQKIVPFLKAIHDEIPFDFLFVVIVSLTAGVLLPTHLPIAPLAHPIVDLIVRRILLGGFLGTLTYFMLGLCFVLVYEKITPIVKRIRDNFKKHQLLEKKKILNNVIDDEVLK